MALVASGLARDGLSSSLIFFTVSIALHSSSRVLVLHSAPPAVLFGQERLVDWNLGEGLVVRMVQVEWTKAVTSCLAVLVNLEVVICLACCDGGGLGGMGRGGGGDGLPHCGGGEPVGCVGGLGGVV